MLCYIVLSSILHTGFMIIIWQTALQQAVTQIYILDMLLLLLLLLF